ERGERGGYGETMLCDGKLDDRAILGRRREREPDLLGGDLHRIQRVIGDRTRTDERGAGTDGDDDEADAERAHRVRRRLAENFERDGDAVDERDSARTQGLEDARPNSGARPCVRSAEGVLVQMERETHGLAELRVLDVLEEPIAPRNLLDQP